MSSQRNAAATAPLYVVALAFVWIVTGCSSGTSSGTSTPSMISVEVNGSDGVHFSGNLGDQISREEFTDVPVPKKLELQGPIGSVILTVRKVESDGLISVRVLRDGIEVASTETTAPFGTINLTIPEAD